MILADLLEGVKYPGSLERAADREVRAVWDDSRRVTPGSLFAALAPLCDATRDGEAFIPEAVARGAVAVIVADGRAEAWRGRFPGVVFVPVQDPRAAFRSVVGRFFENPSRRVRVLGVTGTNGKTTITYFLESIIKAAGRRSGVLGTVNQRVGERILPSKNTTPGLLDNQIFLAQLARDAVDYAVMEVSSHALAQQRVELIDFRSAIFTNLTGDHLDFHKTMEAYFQAKARLFTGLSPDACAVINADDPWGLRLKGLTRARVITCGFSPSADVSAHVEEVSLAGTRFKVRFFGQELMLRTHFIGTHNIHNILGAFAAALGEGFSPEIIRAGIGSLMCVPGRLERVDAGQDFCVFIDYAHTDDGLKNVLTCLKTVPHNRLIVVFGCGGDRDRTKRPRMGKVASQLADLAILTSDNPRSEDPRTIIDEIVPGFTGHTYEVVPDREAAIARALVLAGKDDIVLLAGKGHETTQVFKDRTVAFVEKDIVMKLLKGK